MVCATILARNCSSFLNLAGKAASVGCDVVELRVDHLDERTKACVSEIVTSSPVPVVATVRSERDGGLFPSANETQRLELIEQVIENSPAFVDLELEIDTHIRSALTNKARRKHVGVIVSYHDFRCTPSLSKIAKIAKSELRTNPDLAKLVFTPRDAGDVSKILEMASRLFPGNRSYTIFGIGGLGKVTRLTSLLLGGSLIYCSLGKTNPKLGQINANEVIDYLQRMERLDWGKLRENRLAILRVLKEQMKIAGEIDPEFDPAPYVRMKSVY
ncbi:MAG: type I 3-dehydroquinate dehydratase [Nitrososphaerota archaeon]|nr:type I 3-dehydroquinate dehydratase [Nitrososphaerota archaeon]